MRKVIDITFFELFHSSFFISFPIIILLIKYRRVLRRHELFKHNLVKIAQESLLLASTKKKKKMMEPSIKRRDNNVNRERSKIIELRRNFRNSPQRKVFKYFRPLPRFRQREAKKNKAAQHSFVSSRRECLTKK